MKHTIYGIALAAIAIIVIAAALVTSGKDVRENEMDKALNTAVEESLDQLKKEGGYEVADYKELVADFNQALLLHISSDSEVKVDVLAADVTKGVLDVQVTEEYKTVKGTAKQASCRKTVILEEYSDKQIYHTITFLVDGEIYTSYSVYKGSLVAKPKDPEKEGHTFKQWINAENGEVLGEDMTAESDMTFQVEWD